MTVLDHVAVAVEHWTDAWPRYVGELGARWRNGGHGPGFSPAQLDFANGMRLEVLMPNAVEQNDFLRRFLDASGPGVHHLTFKVPDIEAGLAAAETAGFHPVGIDLTDPEWQEGFIHPREATGIVVQLAQTSGPSWQTPPPRDFPDPAATPAPASLDRVTHVVADLDEGRRLFEGLLEGEQTGTGSDEAGRWVDLAWPGPGRVRLVEPASPTSPLAATLRGKTGRVHHLAFTTDDAGDERVVEPEDNLGVRLVVRGGGT